jgi:hypothetical protein
MSKAKRQRYNFSGLVLCGDGATPQEAWEDAIACFTSDPGDMPSWQIFPEDQDEVVQEDEWAQDS